MGSFNGWTKGIAAEKKGSQYVATVDCKPGTDVEFRWIVDGLWTVSDDGCVLSTL